MNQTQALITDTNKTPLVQIFVWLPLATSFMGAEYSASLLYITSLYFAKMSIVLFIDDFTPIPAERMATKILGLVISLVVAAVSCQLYYSNEEMHDPTFDPWTTTICNQIVQCLSIVTACVPYLKPFLDSLESGMLRTDDLRRRGGTTVEGYRDVNVNSSEGSKRAKIGKIISQKLSLTSQDDEDDQELADFVPAHPAGQSDAVIAVDEGFLWDGQSQTSQSRIIKKTRTWKVDVN
ncbi:hypothetical protein SS1G_05294 [Sclerotinia sclerotiorum 1980 UF-70]|uniref:Integral membrane protein n=1 Tax=Sclerotinia sclerotiorum (strain ATCC 18683 / 1980 / Ss-1) TaxID=665079 RepID=A7EJ01_SCLS1|nr:hypothetical protein SS1G_05294 [Sclerotinia sclerotiorum 1980 UF-70]EDO02817.1 hypothetical protein SS1G_05294 [Sclerotinia sclerotiorum 1980 UF-70]